MTAVYPEPNRHRRPEDEPVDLAALERSPRTVTAQIAARVAKSPHRVAFRTPAAAAGGARTRTWAEFRDEAHLVAAGLAGLGVARGDRVGLLSGTRYEWVLADAGIIHAGAATSPLYPTAIPEEIRHIIVDSGARAVFVEDAAQLARLTALAGALPGVAEVVVLDDAPGAPGPAHWRVRTLDELRDRGRAALAADPGLVDRRVAELTPADLRSLMYTSGTTGPPKGVRLSHRTMAFEGAVTRTLDIIGEGEVHYLWLPLSHAFGQVLLAASIEFGAETVIDGDPEHLMANLPEYAPVFLACVPRVLEKVHAGVGQAMESAGGVKAALYRWAMGVGHRHFAHRVAGTAAPAGLRLAHRVADRLVFAKIRARFGGRVRAIMSGAAPLGEEIATWFAVIGMPVLEGWGMTECGAAATVNRMTAWRAGTVGWRFPGTELRIAADGEILLRGPHVMDGYHGLPEATAETIDPEGWLRTGDIGELDERGFLRITDRKKQLFKTSTGKYVAPGRIEATLGAACPYLAQVIVGGAGEKFVSALITLDEPAVAAWAAEHGVPGETLAHFAAQPAVRELISGYVDQVNATLSPWERIGRFTLIDREFSIEAGELTPTMKLRRRTIMENFGHLLDAHYR